MGRKQLTPDGAARRAAIVQMRTDRRPWREIAGHFGISITRAFQIYTEGIHATPNAAVAVHRFETEQLADEAIRSLLEIARDESAPPRSRVEAWHAIKAWVERLNRMHATDQLRIEQPDYMGRVNGIRIARPPIGEIDDA